MNETSNHKTPESKPNIPARVWNWLTAPHPSIQEIGEYRAARLASSFTLAISFFTLVGFFASGSRVGLQEALSTFGFTVGTSVAAYLLSRTKIFKFGIFIFALSFCASGFINIITNANTGETGTVIMIYVPLGLIVASNFLPWPAVFLLTGLNMAAFFSMPFFGVPLPDGAGGLAGIITTIGIVLIVLKNFQDGVEKARLSEVQTINRELEELSRGLEERVQQRTIDLEQRSLELQEQSEKLQNANVNIEKNAQRFEAVTNVSRAMSQIRDLQVLLPRITQLISEYFGYYHVGIFLVDEIRDYALLSAANSEGGQAMLARKHRLKVGETGIVGYVTGTGRPRIALDVGEDRTFFNNPDLPETHSEMALPLRVGSEIIGALDIQSTETNAFSENDINSLSTLADLVSIAIENARLFTNAQKSIGEAEALSSQYMRAEWKTVTERLGISGFRYNRTGSLVLESPIDTPSIREVIKKRDVYISSGKDQGESTLAVPIKLRDQVIGVININNPSKSEWTEDDLDIAQAVAERLAISAENARLLQDSQRRAAKEQTIGEISAKLSASINIDNVLRTALLELGQVIPGSEIFVDFEQDENA